MVANRGAMPTGSVHKSRGDLTVCMCVQLNMCVPCCVVCVSILQRGQYGEACSRQLCVSMM